MLFDMLLKSLRLLDADIRSVSTEERTLPSHTSDQGLTT